MKKEKIFVFIIIFISFFVQVRCKENNLKEIYGIKSGDSIIYVNSQIEKYGFRVEEKPIFTETGQELGLYLYRGEILVLIVVILENKVHWIDVLEEGVNMNGIVVGTNLLIYQNREMKIEFYAHRDCSLDDIICMVGNIKTIVDNKYWDLVLKYKNKKNSDLLNNILIKGIEL